MTLNIEQVAQELETDAKTARRFLRSVVPQHDPNHRWQIKAEDIEELKLLFAVREVGLKRSVEALTAVRRGGKIEA